MMKIVNIDGNECNLINGKDIYLKLKVFVKKYFIYILNESQDRGKVIKLRFLIPAVND